MNKLIFTAITVLWTTVSIAQVQQVWAVPFNYDSNSKDYAMITAVDALGYIYVTGASWSLDYDNDRIITIKYDKNGTEVWRRHVGTGIINLNIRPVAMKLDAAGNVHILASSAGLDNVFTTIKYASNGTFRWMTRYVGLPPDYRNGDACDLDVDAAGNVYVTGHDRYTAGSIPNTEISNYVTIKYDIDGEQQWIRRFNGASPGNGTNLSSAIAVDASGNVCITGTSQLNGQMDIVTVKYSTTGSELWATRHNGTGNSNDKANDIAADAAGNFYVTGYTTSTNNNRDFVTIKYDANGNQTWLQTYGNQQFFDESFAMIIDGNNNVYITGASHELAGTEINHRDFVTIKYNSSGSVLWINRQNVNEWDRPFDIALDTDNNAYLAGKSIDKIVTFRVNHSDGSTHWVKEYTPSAAEPFFGSYHGAPVSIAVDQTGNVYVCGGGQKPSGPNSSTLLTIRYSQCNIVCPGNISINNDAGQCTSIVNFQPVTYSGDCGASFTYSYNTGIAFPVGTTTVSATSDASGASCSFTITVIDNEPPVVTCPPGKTVNMSPGVCYATAGEVNAGAATATDNCSATITGARSDGLPLSSNYPPGIPTITWTATDGTNAVSCEQIINVIDNQPPVIEGESADIVVLSPPNHSMRNVYVAYTATDNCGLTTTLEVTSNEPVNGVGDGDTDPDWIVLDNHNVQLRAERSAVGSGRIYTITIRAVDTYGNVTTKPVEVRVPHDIKSPRSGQTFVVNSTVNFMGEFWDKPGNQHTAKWILDGSAVVNGAVTEPTAHQNGKVTGSYKFTSPGVYKLQMNVTDQNGLMNYSNTNGDLDAIVVIYDPNGGYTYGGGWFPSPTGALVQDQSARGKGSYGFSVNYRNAAKPKGETQFEFKVGSFEFNALNFDYLVVSGNKAQFRGTGKIIGGQSGINFIMTVTDGRLDGTEVDKIRLKIFRNNGQVIYDNQPGASDAADPIQPVADNSIIYVDGDPGSLLNIQNKSIVQDAEVEVKTFTVTAFPNPSDKHFTLLVKTNNTKENILMQVYDYAGRELQSGNVKAGNVIQIGEKFKAGSYLVKVTQGKEVQVMKLVKL